MNPYRADLRPPRTLNPRRWNNRERTLMSCLILVTLYSGLALEYLVGWPK